MLAAQCLFRLCVLVFLCMQPLMAQDKCVRESYMLVMGQYLFYFITFFHKGAIKSVFCYSVLASLLKILFYLFVSSFFILTINVWYWFMVNLYGEGA